MSKLWLLCVGAEVKLGRRGALGRTRKQRLAERLNGNRINKTIHETTGSVRPAFRTTPTVLPSPYSPRTRLRPSYSFVRAEYYCRRYGIVVILALSRISRVQRRRRRRRRRVIMLTRQTEATEGPAKREGRVMRFRSRHNVVAIT